MESSILFYLLSFFIVICSLSVFFNPNPIMSALFLVLSMIGVAFVFFTLNAPFLGGVQLVVYAGAVMVLFVMVIMLFDLKKEERAFSRGFFTRGIKFIISGLILGILANAIAMMNGAPLVTRETETPMNIKYLAEVLYTDYIFSFEILGVLLLVIAIGAVALSRIKGGTHAK